jgi:hypothetical protein
MRIYEILKRKTLYVSRGLLNADDIILWAKSQGLKTMLEPSDLHVTVCFSKKPVTWDIPSANDFLVIPSLDDLVEFGEETKPFRKVEMFGKEHNVLVLQFSSDELLKRNQEFLDHGCSYDFPEYKSHVTISYNASDVDISDIEPYTGVLEFGPEIFKEINDEWANDTVEIDLSELDTGPRIALINDEPK